MRRIVLIIIALMAVAYIVFSLKELENIVEALRESRPLYLGLALLLEAVLICNTAATFWAVYRLVGLKEKFRGIFLIVTGATFVNLVTPTSGMGGMAIFLDEARRRRISPGRVMVACLLYVLYEYIALFSALLAGFFILDSLGKLNMAYRLGFGFMLIVAAGLIIGLLVGYRSQPQLGRLLARVAIFINRLLHPFRHKDTINPVSAYHLSEEMADGLEELHSASVGPVLLPLLFTFINKLLLISILGVSFLALGEQAPFQTLLAGFSVGQLFVYASPTPSGLGIVDSVLPAALTSLGVTLAVAVLASLIYRAFTFWLPLGIGSAALRVLHRRRTGNGEMGETKNAH
jgi:glycosyltransferase 2 family protein